MLHGGDRPAWFGWDRPVLALKAQCPRSPLGPSKVAVWSLAGGTRLRRAGRRATGQTHSTVSGGCREGMEQGAHARGAAGGAVGTAGARWALYAIPAPRGHQGPCVQRRPGLLNPFLGASCTQCWKVCCEHSEPETHAELRKLTCRIHIQRAPSAAVCSWLRIGDR